MKMKVYKADGKTVEMAVRSNNIQVESNYELGSGSMDALRDGKTIQGGYVVKLNSKIIGWGAAFSHGEFHLYLKPKYRGNGLGSRIIKRAKKDFATCYYCPWNSQTLSLFQKHKVKYKTMYLPWHLTKDLKI